MAANSRMKKARKTNMPDQEKITCKECHKRFSFIGTHVRQKHNMDVVGYRDKHGASVPIASPAYLFRLGKSMSVALTGKPKHLIVTPVSMPATVPVVQPVMEEVTA
jgi:predicted transcriptional regulator